MTVKNSVKCVKTGAFHTIYTQWLAHMLSRDLMRQMSIGKYNDNALESFSKTLEEFFFKH